MLFASKQWISLPGIAAIIAGASLMTGPLLAAGSDTARQRHASYRQLGAAFKTINDELKSGSPKLKAIQMASIKIGDASQKQYGWFPKDSAPGPGVKTHAKPAVWSEPAKFRAAQDNFATQAAAFRRIAMTGKMDDIRSATKQLGASCGACHRQFREEH